MPTINCLYLLVFISIFDTSLSSVIFGKKDDVVSSLRISEVMSQPMSGQPNESPYYSSSDFAYIELKNIDTLNILDVGKVKIDGMITFKFPATAKLNPGEYIIVAANVGALLNRYPTLNPACIIGSYKQKLNFGNITILDAMGTVGQTFTFQNWYPDMGGQGFSLNIMEPVGYQSPNWNNQENWFIGSPGGTPCSGDTNGTGAVSFSNSNVFFTNSISVTLTPTANLLPSTIVYTTDLTEPNANSPKGNPVTIYPSTATQVRARVMTGSTLGPVFTQTYIQTTDAFSQFQVFKLPIVVLNTFGQPDYTKGLDPVVSSLIFVDPDLASGTIKNTAVTLQAAANTSIRGSSSALFPKKGWTVKFINGANKKQKYSPLGLPKESKFIFNNPYYTDNIFVRNPTFFNSKRELTGNWSPRTKHFELFFVQDNKPLDVSHYWGIYILIEGISIDSNRIDITEITPLDNFSPNVTGGYVLKIDRPDPAANGADFFVAGGQEFVIDDPDYTTITVSQRQYLINWWGQFSNTLNNIDRTQITPDYMKLIDVQKTIDYHIWQSFSGNVDALLYSTYLVKDQNGPFYWGPLWDLDRTAGCLSFDPWGCSPPSSFLARNYQYTFWNNFFNDPQFVKLYSQRWAYLRQHGFDMNYFTNLVTQYQLLLTPSANRNYARWTGTSPPNGLSSGIQTFLTWLSTRMTLMDTSMCYNRVPTCTDNNYCTADICNLKDSTCLNVPDLCPYPQCALIDNDFAFCNDFNNCTIGDYCLKGNCTGNALNCSDGIDCTDDDCDPDIECVHVPNNGECTTNITCPTATCHLDMGCQYICPPPPTPTPTPTSTPTSTSMPTSTPTSTTPTLSPSLQPDSLPLGNISDSSVDDSSSSGWINDNLGLVIGICVGVVVLVVIVVAVVICLKAGSEVV